MTRPDPASILVYETDFQLKLKGQKGILHPSEDLIRLVARGSIAAKEPGDAALDFGVGDGRHVPYLLSLGYKVTGTDVAPSSLEVTKRLFEGDDRFRGILLETPPSCRSPTTRLRSSLHGRSCIGSERRSYFSRECRSCCASCALAAPF